jgi:hypothetical protein
MHPALRIKSPLHQLSMLVAYLLVGPAGFEPAVGFSPIGLKVRYSRPLSDDPELVSRAGFEPALRCFGGVAPVRWPGDELVPQVGVEPTRATFVASSPNSLGPAALNWLQTQDSHLDLTR